MQWLASICVRRPVFATVLILFIVVVGIVGYKALNVDRFPNVDLPVVQVITTLAGRGARRDRDRALRQDRRSDQHHQRHRRAALDLDRGRVAGRRLVPARQGHQRRRAGGARPRLDDPAGSARGDQEPGRQQAGPRRRAGAVPGARVRAAHPRGHRVRRPRDPPGAGEHLGRRPGHHHRRPQAPGSGGAGSRAAARRRPDRRRRSARHRRAERDHAGRHRRHRPAAAHVPRQRPRQDASPPLGDIVIRSVDNHPIAGQRRRPGRRRRRRGRHRRQHRAASRPSCCRSASSRARTASPSSTRCAPA